MLKAKQVLKCFPELRPERGNAVQHGLPPRTPLHCKTEPTKSQGEKGSYEHWTAENIFASIHKTASACRSCVCSRNGLIFFPIRIFALEVTCPINTFLSVLNGQMAFYVPIMVLLLYYLIWQNYLENIFTRLASS